MTTAKARAAKPSVKKLGAKPAPRRPVPAPTKDLFRDTLLRVLLRPLVHWERQ